MSQTTEKTPNRLVIISSAATGYWRGGIQFAKGENHIDAEALSEEQLDCINGDHRLQVLQGEADETQTNPDPSQQGAVDTGSVEPLTQLKLIIPELEQGNKAHFTKDGRPQVEALAAHGLKLKAKERDELWATFSATLDGDDDNTTDESNEDKEDNGEQD